MKYTVNYLKVLRIVKDHTTFVADICTNELMWTSHPGSSKWQQNTKLLKDSCLSSQKITDWNSHQKCLSLTSPVKTGSMLLHAGKCNGNDWNYLQKNFRRNTGSPNYYNVMRVSWNPQPWMNEREINKNM